MQTITTIVPSLVANFPDNPDRDVISAAEWNQRFDLLTEQGNRSQNTLKDIIDTTNLHLVDTSNPHGVTLTQLGIPRVENTNDLEKPISTLTQAALDNKVDKVADKGLVKVVQLGGLSTEDVMSQKAVVDYVGTLGGGDMTKTVYDPENLGAEAFCMKADFTDAVAVISQDISDLETAVAAIDLPGVVTTDTYAGLTTTSKTVQGAINEIKSTVDNLSEDSIIVGLPASGYAQGVKLSWTAGESLVFGNVCKINSSSKLIKASNTAIANASAFAMSLGSYASDATGEFLLQGTITLDSWTFTPGALVFLGTTGGFTHAAPTATNNVVQVIGVATATHTLYFNPQLVQVEVTA